MRAVKIAAAVMAVLIVVGTTVLVVTVARRLSAPAVVPTAAAVLDEPAGTSIVGITAVGDRLAVLLHGGGPDRVVFVDARGGVVAGGVSLRR